MSVHRSVVWFQQNCCNQGVCMCIAQCSMQHIKHKLDVCLSESIQTASKTLFDDALEDFSDMDLIRSRFEDWKSQFGETYKEAYISLCVPKLVTPFVRLQLLTWNPLQVSIFQYLQSPKMQGLSHTHLDKLCVILTHMIMFLCVELQCLREHSSMKVQSK